MMGKGIKTLFSRKGEETLQKIIDSEEHIASQKGTLSVDADAAKADILVPVDDISPNPFQPRLSFDEDKLMGLSESIKDRGVLQPIVVRRSNLPSGHKYELVAGERRLRAAKLAGLLEVPVIVKADAGDNEMKILTITENMQREDLSVVEKTLCIGSLQHELGDTASIADTLKLTQRSVERYVRIFKIVNSSKALLSLFKRNAHAIDFRAAEEIADIGKYLKQEEFDRFVSLTNNEGIKTAIKYFRKPLGARLGHRSTRSILYIIKETETNLSLRLNYEKGTEFRKEDKEKIEKTFDDFLARLEKSRSK